MTTQVLTVRPKGEELAVRDPESLLRFAVEKGADVETIERLMNVRRELKAEQAREAFNAALAAFQSECPVIKKTKFGARNAYKYAPLEQVVSQVKDLLLKHGFCFSVTSDIEPNWIKAICTLTHREGHAEKSEFKVPTDSRNTMMNDPQKYAGSMTFAKRYALCNCLGILTADEDLDGGDKAKPSGPSTLQPQSGDVKPLARELWNLLKPVRGTENNWSGANQWMWDEGVISDSEAAPELTPDRFREAIEKAKAKL